MRSIWIAACFAGILLSGCTDAIVKMMDKTNTVTVKNRSGLEIPKVVVLEDRIHHTFKNLDQFYEASHMFSVRKPTTSHFTITVSFADGASASTNALISFDPVELTDTLIVIETNRIISIKQRRK